MRFLAIIYLTALAFVAFPGVPGNALAQKVAVFVNGEPITSYDIEQRRLWQIRTTNFGERMKALLTGDEVKRKFQERMSAAQPQTQAEAQEAAGRIKKELIEDAKRQLLSEGGAATGSAVIEALIDDKLKLKAAKDRGIEITDEEVEENLAARASAKLPPGQKPDMIGFYQQFEADGINRKTIQEIIRVQLAWRDAIRRTYNLPGGPETEGAYEGFSRSVLEKSREKAIIEKYLPGTGDLLSPAKD